jgi:hypothetical protein
MEVMNPDHVHLSFSHLPILRTAIGTVLLLSAFALDRVSWALPVNAAAVPTARTTLAPGTRLVLVSEPVVDVGESHEKRGETMTFTIPHPLKLEHEELHATLAQATKAGGKVGEAAKAVAKLLRAHFVKEEEYALPPLGLLSSLAAGKVMPEMSGVLPMTDRLKRELPEMLAEHKAIVAALEQLAGTARQTGNSEYVHFAEQLKLHAQTEEDVLYPAAILIGEYLKLKLGK